MELLFAIIFCILVLGIFQLARNNRILQKKISVKDADIKKIWVNSELLKDWLTLRQNNIYLVDWLLQNNIRKVAVYGYGVLGKMLLQELKGSMIEIICVVDKNYKNIHSMVPAVSPNDVPECDAIIVSVINYFDEIESELLKKYHYPIISLEDIVYGVGYKFNE